ncbi:putative diguanylate cyclase YdaM [Methyloligella halotolerans]|uniref:diguanylate cyclase n=1 Tax=Methyloligella halotolerans TaxID=1177755 RepID=A0A1E2RW43_9HYPH|nr:diguanylate cyclase [Methyloligella halotolerans]ODA66433.1 putative diguanylate cyclase YdaM [Methyloligella halotolerans]
MAEFLESQLDFIFFFYGLAFILLGAVCFAIRRTDNHAAWMMLGTFGLVHGASEWLDLVALISGDSANFAWFRTAVMVGSYLFLFEFARVVAIESRFRSPGRWIYILLLIPVVIGGWLGGNAEANACGRYFIGFPAATATAFVFAYHAHHLARRDARLALGAATGFALYGIAAGLIVPAAPIWPATVANYGWFADLTGLPIQLVRGILACWMSFAIWSIWGQKLIERMASAGYAKHLYRLYVATLVTLAVILGAGWVLTQYLGNIYKENIEADAEGQVALVKSHLSREMDMLDAMAISLAGSPTVRTLLTEGGPSAKEEAVSVLALDVQASNAVFGFLMDRAGMVVVSAAGGATAEPPPQIRMSPIVSRTLLGQTVHQLIYGDDRDQTRYNVSVPVRDDAGAVVGAVVMEKSLDRFASDLAGLDMPFMLTDRNGIVTLSNNPNMLLKPLWPLSPQREEAAARRYGALNLPPLFKSEIEINGWRELWGARTFVEREPVGHSGWSIVTFTTARGIFASRVLGIIITLMTTATAIVYLMGRERHIHDQLQMDRQSELEALAKDLSQQASTDALTGLSNRMSFDRRLLLEIARADRYDTPLSLIIFDIDHFKQINDQHGHQVGDTVLTELSGLFAERLRKTDFLARWGGEEFAVIVPHGELEAAVTLAETLRQAVAEGTFSSGGDVTCSFGVAELEPGDKPETLLARADAALYAAKLNGRNRVEQAPRSQPASAGLHRVA